MGPGELPRPAEAPKQADIERIDSEVRESFDPLAPEVENEVLDRGEVRRMVLPKGWILGEVRDKGEEKQYSYATFHPREAANVLLWYFYRGYKMNEREASEFKQVLDKPAHMLTAPETRSVAQIIRDKSDPDNFRLMAAKTEEINGKKVLVVEGRYVEADDDAYSIYIDADRLGRTVQELHFRAPKDQYHRYLKDAKSAFGSIAWK